VFTHVIDVGVAPSGDCTDHATIAETESATTNGRGGIHPWMDTDGYAHSAAHMRMVSTGWGSCREVGFLFEEDAGTELGQRDMVRGCEVANPRK
jgi:hypothetical protein